MSDELDLLRISCRDLSAQVYALREEIATVRAALAVALAARDKARAAERETSISATEQAVALICLQSEDGIHHCDRCGEDLNGGEAAR